MGKPLDLEILREILSDKRLHVGIGVITKLEMAKDRSVFRVMVKIFPEEREVICRMTWDAVGPEAGFYQLPSLNDAVIIGFADGDDDHGFVLRRLSSKEDKLPLEIDGNHAVIKALAGKEARIVSDTLIQLCRPGATAGERLVLGEVFKVMMSTVLQLIADHKHIGNFGYYTTVPDNELSFLAQKADPIDNSAILSDIAKTEK